MISPGCVAAQFSVGIAPEECAPGTRGYIKMEAACAVFNYLRADGDRGAHLAPRVLAVWIIGNGPFALCVLWGYVGMRGLHNYSTA